MPGEFLGRIQFVFVVPLACPIVDSSKNFRTVVVSDFSVGFVGAVRWGFAAVMLLLCSLFCFLFSIFLIDFRFQGSTFETLL